MLILLFFIQNLPASWRSKVDTLWQKSKIFFQKDDKILFLKKILIKDQDRISLQDLLNLSLVNDIGRVDKRELERLKNFVALSNKKTKTIFSNVEEQNVIRSAGDIIEEELPANVENKQELNSALTLVKQLSSSEKKAIIDFQDNYIKLLYQLKSIVEQKKVEPQIALEIFQRNPQNTKFLEQLRNGFIISAKILGMDDKISGYEFRRKKMRQTNNVRSGLKFIAGILPSVLKAIKQFNNNQPNYDDLFGVLVDESNLSLIQNVAENLDMVLGLDLYDLDDVSKFLVAKNLIEDPIKDRKNL